MKVAKKLTIITLLAFICSFIILQTSKIDSYAATPSKSIQNDIPDYDKKVKNKYTGWIKSKSKTVKLPDGTSSIYYYMNKGALVTGWKTISGYKYYFKSDYTMVYGVESIIDGIYVFGICKNDYGKLIQCNCLYQVPSYYNNKYANITTVWSLDKNGKVIKNGWNYTSGLQVGYAYTENYTPFRSGWKKISGKWYYFNNYRRCTGWITDSGKYYLDSNGVMVKGLQTISGKKYFFNDSGKMQTGWKKISGYWYYFKTDGSAIIGTTAKIGNKTYAFRSNGTCVNP